MSASSQRLLFVALVIVGLVIAGTGVVLMTQRSSEGGKPAAATLVAHRALPLGRSASSGGVRVTVLAVDDPASDVTIPAPAGDRWVSVQARTCVASGHPGLQTGWYQFSASDAAGDRFPGIVWPQGVPGGAAPLPSIYPQYETVTPGTCVSGSLLVPVPRQVTLTDVVHTGAEGVQTGEWSIAG